MDGGENIGHVKAERWLDCHRGIKDVMERADGTFFKRALGRK